MKTALQFPHVRTTTLREALVYDLGLHIVAGLGSQIKAFIATMESQGTKMLARANKVRTYAHAKIG